MQSGQLKRRELITLLGGAAAWPLVASAQQQMPVIGFLSPGSPGSPGSPETDTYVYRMDAVRRGLAQIGYVEGQNVAIEYRGAEYQYEHLPALAADLVSRQVSVIIVVSSTPTRAAKAATNTIPIVFSVGGDPVQLGIVRSLNRPVENLTGVYNLNTAVIGKRLELLREMIPATAAIALIVNPGSAVTELETKELNEAAHALGLKIHILNAASESQIDAAFATLAKERSVPVLSDNSIRLRSRLVG
jgi:ABC-type uncharacterized transport system substrate-binding protein